MSRFEEMEVFVSVVDAGSITRAAERLNIAKSAVSRRLSELEGRLQVQLFIRTTRKLTLTDTGRSYYERCLQILADVEETEALVTRDHRELTGRLRVALPSSFAQRHMTDALTDFIKAHPRLFLDVDFNDRRVDIIQEGFDVAIRIGALQDSTLVARRLARVRMILCASPGYLEQAGTPGSAGELQAHRVLGYSLSQDASVRFFDADRHLQRVNVPLALSVNSGEFIMEAGIKGLGLVWEPTFILHQALESGQLVPVLPGYHWDFTYAHILYPQTRHLSARVRGFVDFMLERFAGVPPWDCRLFEMGILQHDNPPSGLPAAPA